MVSERFDQGLYYDNLGISYNGGTGVFSVLGANGRDLSTSNPAVIVLPSKASPGLFTRYNVTSNQTFIDDVGSSEIIGNLFGATTGVAWAQDVPFFIYAVGNDNENTIAFMISRVPSRLLSPSAANIGAPDDPVADTQGSFFSLENIDESTYDANPCVCLGSFRMQMSASDDWTVQTLSSIEGIGRFQENTSFTFPTGQIGAASGTHFQANGGTAPVFSTQNISYYVNRDGKARVYVAQNGDGGTDGAGAVTAQMSLPLVISSPLSVASGEVFFLNSVGLATQRVYPAIADGNNYVRFVVEDGSANVQNGDFTNGARSLNGTLTYQMSTA